ncbi:hypothetical protein DSCW_57960 [Desulfosarcina widdelii]|uniref:Uncharacterized protein n=1 Tax=Desulfosarcina widdelii TaxID=947919 RepID=A0A5K7ZDW3_9BACT|nr:hypothetical protein [Desulfosarcina widdelii]BBO78379.1 hypothetical protein DSCW_57960 [Desulfosarcina widdelii]
MDRLGELIGALSDDAVVARSVCAKTEGTCKLCGRPATFFRTQFSKLEYNLSSICQACQDYYFLGEE